MGKRLTHITNLRLLYILLIKRKSTIMYAEDERTGKSQCNLFEHEKVSEKHKFSPDYTVQDFVGILLFCVFEWDLAVQVCALCKGI